MFLWSVCKLVYAAYFKIQTLLRISHNTTLKNNMHDWPFHQLKDLQLDCRFFEKIRKSPPSQFNIQPNGFNLLYKCQ